MYIYRLYTTRNQWQFFLSLVLLLMLFACNSDSNKDQVETFDFVIPEHFPSPIYTFENNKPTKKRFELGRYLFYDKGLSIDGTISCADCHAQVHAFADHNSKYSIGVNGKTGKRNSPPIFNTAWQPNFMWDGGITHIETMPFAPITNPVEMANNMKDLMKKINKNDFLKSSFKNAYGVDSITDRHLLIALAQFMSFIISDNSSYDQYLKGEINFTSKELHGLSLYKKHCSSCHEGVLFTSNHFFNNGLAINGFGDVGRMKVTQNEEDKGKFKVPSLRNVELTYPYMHDGRFRSLDQVLDFYSEGKKHELVDEKVLKIGHLSDEDKSALIAFLKTLTDYTFVGNPMYGEPIKK